MSIELISILLSVVCLLGAWYAYSDLIPCSYQDLRRQNFFALRDELFDYATEGKIEFDNPAYCITRETLNGFIRYTHRINFIQALFVHLDESKESEAKDSFVEMHRKSMLSLNDEQKDFIQSVQVRMHVEVIRLLVDNSLIFKPVIILSRQLEKLKDSFKRIVRWTRVRNDLLASFDSDAYYSMRIR